MEDEIIVRNSEIFDESFDVGSFKHDLILSIGAEQH